MQGEKKIIEEDNRSIGYFWFEQHPEKKEIFINSIQIAEQFQRKGLGTFAQGSSVGPITPTNSPFSILNETPLSA